MGVMQHRPVIFTLPMYDIFLKDNETGYTYSITHSKGSN